MELATELSCVISCGYSHSACLSPNGEVFVFGSNKRGQLGVKQLDSGESRSYIPRPIDDIPRMISVCCGANHIVCIDENFCVWGWGDNSKNQLGLEFYKNDTEQPQILDNGLPPIMQIACGGLFTVCLDFDGNIWTFGGLKLSSPAVKPKMQTTIQDVKQIACGSTFIIALTNSGDLCMFGEYFEQYSWKKNYSFTFTSLRICDPNITDIQCGENSFAYISSGSVYCVGPSTHRVYPYSSLTEKYFRTEPTKIEEIPEIIKISCGCHCLLMLDYENNVWCFGKNKSCTLGVRYSDVFTPKRVETLKDISHIGVGKHHSIVFDGNSGDIYGFGNNVEGQLGSNNYAVHKEPIKMKSELSFPIGNRRPSTAKSAKK